MAEMRERENDKWGTRKAAQKARKTFVNTCPASRHVHMMADGLWKRGVYPMFEDEPRHCALGIYSVLHSLWKARHALMTMTPDGIVSDDPDGLGWWWESKKGRRFLKKKATRND